MNTATSSKAQPLGTVATDSNARSGFRGWIILVVLMFTFVPSMVFPFFGAGVLNGVMATDLGISRQAIALGFSLMALCSGILGPVSGAIIRRIGARLTMTIGALFITLAAVLMATVVQTDTAFVICFGPVLGFGVCLAASLPAQGVVTQWFQRRVALALSILWMAVGGGGAVMAPLLGGMLEATGGNWRMGWWVLAVLALVSSLLCAVVIRNRPADIGQYPDGIFPHGETGPGKTAPLGDVWTVRKALGTRAFWTILVSGAVYAMPLTLMFTYMRFHLGDLGFAPALAAAVLGLLGGAQVGGKLIVGILGDRLQPRYLWATAMLCMAVGLILLIKASTTAHVYIAAAMLGIGQGGCMVAMPAMVGRYFGRDAFVGLYSSMTPVITLGVATAPLLVGYTQHWLGKGYGFAWAVLAVMLVLTAVAILFAKPPES